MKRQLVFYLSIAIATIAIIILATARSRWISPNSQNAGPQTPQYPAILYSITDLGTLGGNESYSYGLNDLGQVVGSSLTEDGEKHAFIWDSINGMQDLDPKTRFDLTARRIGNLGQVVGSGRQRQNTNKTQGFFWEGTRGIQYWKAASLSDINDAGQIVGKSLGDRAALWNGAEDVSDLGVLKKDSISSASHINNAIQIVGWSGSCQKWPCGDHAFLWEEETGMTDLGTLGSNDSWAYGINDLGQVVGCSTVRGGFYGERRAFLWDKTRGMQDIGTFGGKQSVAKDINNSGRVVGWIENEKLAGMAFLWDKTRGMQDLNNLIDPQVGWKLARAHDINERGWIVGTGFLNGNQRAFLLTPEVSKK